MRFPVGQPRPRSEAFTKDLTIQPAPDGAVCPSSKRMRLASRHRKSVRSSGGSSNVGRRAGRLEVELRSLRAWCRLLHARDQERRGCVPRTSTRRPADGPTPLSSAHRAALMCGRTAHARLGRRVRVEERSGRRGAGPGDGWRAGRYTRRRRIAARGGSHAVPKRATLHDRRWDLKRRHS